MTSPWPISFDDVLAARDRLRPYLSPSPLRQYPLLDELVGHGIRVFVKHENHLPVQTFKVRNGLSALTALGDVERSRGVIGASTGNHGQGMAYAAQLLGIPCTIVVPVGNNPDKNAAIRALGATLVEFGATYDASAMHCAELAESRGLTLIHGINNLHVMAGAATMSLEMLEQEPGLDTVFIALGGGWALPVSIGITALALFAVGSYTGRLAITAVSSSGDSKTTFGSATAADPPAP